MGLDRRAHHCHRRHLGREERRAPRRARTEENADEIDIEGAGDGLAEEERLDGLDPVAGERPPRQVVPGGVGDWTGGIFTPSDARAEPTLASSAIAKAALDMGVVIIEQCAVRTLQMSAGVVSGVVTEIGGDPAP